MRLKTVEKIRLRLRRFRAANPGVLALLLFGAVSTMPAGQQPQQPNPLGQVRQSPFDPSNQMDPLLAERQLRALNVERQKSMVSDTEKLLKLARELNDEIQTGNPDAELRKIADIEKLARNVKQKMSASLVGVPAFHDPVSPPFR
jgi:hypothetical protein